MTAEGFQILVNASDWANLKILDVSGNLIGDQALETLSSKKWPGLENLILSKISITAEGLKSLVSISKWSNLRILDVSDNSIGDKGLQFLSGAFTSLENLPSLESLNLRNIGITAEGMNSLISIPKLKILDISHNSIGEKGLKNFISGKWFELESLNLSKIGMTAEGVKILVNSSDWVKLKILDLSDNLIHDAGLKFLASGKWPELENLNLKNTSITTDGIKSLLSTSPWLSLKVLDRSYTSMKEKGLEIISSQNWRGNLTFKGLYNIAETGIDDMKKISNWPNLKTLDISHNLINDKGLELLWSAHLPLIKSLNLTKISITSQGIESMVKSSKWPNLKEIYLEISEEESVELKKLIYAKWPNVKLTRESEMI